MKTKLAKFSLISFLIFLPFPFIFEWSMFFGGVYIAFWLIASGATARALGLSEVMKNANN